MREVKPLTSHGIENFKLLVLPFSLSPLIALKPS